MVSPEDLLTTTAEVAITVAGFSGVVAALAPRSQGSWPAGSRAMLSTLLLSSGAIVAFSFLPLVMLLALEDASIWPLASAIHATYLVAVSSLRVRAYRAEVRRRERPIWLMAVGPVIFMSAAALQAANASFIRAPWPYVGAVVLATLASFVVFAAILHLFWSQED